MSVGWCGSVLGLRVSVRHIYREKGKLSSALESTQPPRLQWCASFFLLYLFTSAPPSWQRLASYSDNGLSFSSQPRPRPGDSSTMRPTLFILLALCLVAACRAAAEEEYEYDDEPAPTPVTQAPARPAGRLGSLLSPRGRASPAARKPAAATSTTAKPVEQAVEEEDVEDEEILEDSQEQEEVQTTTTESSKKLRGGGIRPFRSNQDLLAALKRRRVQAGTVVHTPSTTQASADSTTSKSKTSSSGRGRSNAAAEAPSRTSGRGRFGGNTRGNKPVQEEVEETQQEEVQVKPKPYRRG